MDLIQSQVVHKVGRKWKPRWAVLRKISESSEGLTLLFYKSANHAKQKRRVKHAVYLTDFCESFKLAKIEKVQNILAIIMVAQTEFVSYENLEVRDEWEKLLDHNYGKEAEFRVTVPIKQKLKPGDACLGIYRSFFSLSSNSTCRAVGRWALKDLFRYALVEGSFYFEIKRDSKRKTYVYSLASDECDSILQEFDEVLEKEDNYDTEMVSIDFHGSGILDDLERARRRDTTDHNIFQRTMLRMSNRFRRRRHKRSETFAAIDSSNMRNEGRLRSESGDEDGRMTASANDLIRCKERRPKLSVSGEDRPQRPSGLAAAQRSSSFGHFGSTHAKSKSASELPDRRKPLKSTGSGMKFNPAPSTKSESFRGASVSSDVFIDDLHHEKDPTSVRRHPMFDKTKSEGKGSEQCKSESVLYKGTSTSDYVNTKDVTDSKTTGSDGPPVAPPRSPLSLGMFTYPSPDQSIDSNDSELKRTYVNRDDLAISKDDISSPVSDAPVQLRHQESVSLLEEIDKEYKRRTNTSLMEGSSSAASVESSRNSADVESEFAKQDKRLEGGAQPSVDVPRVRGAPGFQVEAMGKEQSVFTNGIDAVDSGGKPPAEGMNGHGPSVVSASDRVAWRETGTKHLSDPALTRLTAVRETGSGSLIDLDHHAQYVNIQDSDDDPNIAGSYVNVSATGSLNPSPGPKRSKPKKKPPPLKVLKTPWEKYDDDESAIYHRVGPLVGANGTRSSEHINAYQNVAGHGSYENIAGRGMVRERGYINMPSPSSKKPQSLQYVMLGGTKDNVDNLALQRRHSPLLKASDQSDKVDYTMIDEKATWLIKKTRDEHQLTRNEETHTKPAKRGK